MNITFVGTGEACDVSRRNTSILLTHEKEGHLLDCGFTSAPGLLQNGDDASLATIWVSHFHGDHFFGIPQLLAHWYGRKRRAPLTILSGEDCQEKLHALLELAYPGLLQKLGFPLLFTRIPLHSTVEHGGLNWQIAPVNHSIQAFALKVSTPECAIYYSGDGKPTSQAVALMKECDLVIHEAFSLHPSKPNHGSIEECLHLAKENTLPRLALVHLNSETRQVLRNGPHPPEPPVDTQLLFPNDNDKLAL